MDFRPVAARLGGLFPAWAFAGYVLWLTAFPMSGSLLNDRADLFWFLLPHTGLLFALGRFCGAGRFDVVGRVGVLLTMVLTGLFPLLPAFPEALLVLMGLSAAPVSLRAGVALKSASSPVLAALTGLVVGNTLLLPIARVPDDAAGFAVAALALLPLLFATAPRQALRAETRGLFSYLAFVFVFQLVSGLMYGFLYPAYANAALWPGSELLFYMTGASLATLLVVRGQSDIALIVGVVWAMAAFVLLIYGAGTRLVTPSMYAMMLAAGTIDLFLLGHVLSFPNVLRAYGYGTGVLCTGIVAGRVLAMAVSEAGDEVGLVGSIALNVSVLVLFLMDRRRATSTAVPPGQDAGILPPALLSRLSDQERLVLEGVLERRTYKDIARQLGISESSVKTYMHRIYEKTGVTGKRQLMSRLHEHPHANDAF
jgi:DNA-binding CsgD family transcriptional regulator